MKLRVFWIYAASLAGIVAFWEPNPTRAEPTPVSTAEANRQLDDCFKKHPPSDPDRFTICFSERALATGKAKEFDGVIVNFKDDEFKPYVSGFTPGVTTEIVPGLHLGQTTFAIEAHRDRTTGAATVLLSITMSGLINAGYSGPISRRGGAAIQPVAPATFDVSCSFGRCFHSVSAVYPLPSPKEDPSLYEGTLDFQVQTSELSPIIRIPASHLAAIRDWLSSR
jgi:hypothetical protein